MIGTKLYTYYFFLLWKFNFYKSRMSVDQHHTLLIHLMIIWSNTSRKLKEVWGHETSLIPPLSTEVSAPKPGTWAVMYFRLSDIDYELLFSNCSDSVVFFFFILIHVAHFELWKNTQNDLICNTIFITYNNTLFSGASSIYICRSNHNTITCRETLSR